MKNFTTLFKLYQYLTFCPSCQENTRQVGLKYRDDNYSTKRGTHKGKNVSFTAYSHNKLNVINGVEFEIKFILDQENNCLLLKTNPLYVKYLKYLHLKAFPDIAEGHFISFNARCDKKGCNSNAWSSAISCNFHQRTISGQIIITSENIIFDQYNIFYYLETDTNAPKWRISSKKDQYNFSKSFVIDALDVEFADHVNLRRKLQTALNFA